MSTALTAEAWPPDYAAIINVRVTRLQQLKANPGLWTSAHEFYKRPENFIHWLEDWCVTYDPRNVGTDTPVRMPFIPFQRQRAFAAFLIGCLLDQESGLVEKSRDMGATWLCGAFSIWLWRYWPGAAVGWGSRDADLVDKIGDADSIFEKMRILVRNLPMEMLPVGFKSGKHMLENRFINPENGASITGDAGKNIGRGGRKLIFFKDESAHYEKPESIEAALADNTRIQIDISSVNGLGNVFHRRRVAGVDWYPGAEIPKGKVRVFVFDWKDHPAKTKEWFEQRKQKAIDEGLMHVFAQEVERNYSASVTGTIIPAEWIAAAIDAHIKLGLPPPTGQDIAALDVSDGGNDTNALATRKGYLLRGVEEWGSVDTGKTTRRAVTTCDALGAPTVELFYDCIGVGSGVKAEANRLLEEELMPEQIHLFPWNAGASPEDPDAFIMSLPNGKPDKKSIQNKDFYGNLKAQGWWQLRLRFERTWRAVHEGVKFDPDDLISISSSIPLLRKLEQELSQPTASKSTAKLKLIVDKAPDGTKSPNLADAVMMAFWPVQTRRPMKISPAAMLHAATAMRAGYR